MADELIVLGQNLETASASLGGERLQLIAAEQGRLVARLPTDLTAGEYTLVVLNQSGVDEQQLTLLQGERGEQGEPGTPMSFLMSEDRTLRVPIDFPSLAEALASLDQLRISARATVTVLVEADQVLNEPLEISHPDGERISILGLSAASPAVTLSFGSGDGIVIPRGNKLGGLNHLRLTASDGARGIAVSDGGYASIQSDVRIENFEVCVSANRNSTVIAPGIEAVGCGRGVEASDGSHVTLTGATITNSESNGVFLFNGANARVDDLSVNGAGESGLVVQTGAVAYGENVVVLNADRHGIAVLNGSATQCNGCSVTASGDTGVLANTGSVLRAVNLTVRDSGSHGVSSSRGSVAEVHSEGGTSSITGNTGFGARAIRQSHLRQDGASYSANGMGTTSPSPGAEGSINSTLE